MVKLVSTLGTSPGGVFETFMNLRQGNYEADNPVPVDVKVVYVIRTSDPAVERAFRLLKAIFACCGGRDVEVVGIPLNMNDINSRSDYIQFRREVLSRISSEDYVDFTGGRKAMSVAAVMAARQREAHVITSIIPQSDYNEIQNRMKNFRDEDISAGERGECRVDFCTLTSRNVKTILLE
ncbi:CRISPR-associated ring nuclease Crn1 [Metallosphaera javensis (ex Sakai et al. 2022)]|uniref:CRISPR-associated ring nuclease Crn1 n=1 Tax=Metallosphaera javensis (ex Sakai et al. 2022) TaxID=2775498 RepID=UPI00258B98C3|nr:MAG: CRISPR-associated protein [Metallosphaera javensis (ex Sakai et al. 2022)]